MSIYKLSLFFFSSDRVYSVGLYMGGRPSVHILHNDSKYINYIYPDSVESVHKASLLPRQYSSKNY